MSEVQSRPARGRSTARGGRGSYASRGPRKQTNGDGASSTIDTSAEAGELAELKKRYQGQLSMLKELFPDWTDADLVLAIEDSDGDLERTIEKISEGSVSQFAEVPKKAKDRSRSKAAKENVIPTDGTSSVRGVRGEVPRRGTDSVRGGRGRGTDRGRGGFGGTTRGGRGGATSGPRAAASIPTTESAAWDTTPAAPKENGHATEHAKDDSEHKSTVEAAATAVKGAAKKTWASMFSAPKPVPAPAKPAEKPAPATEESKAVPDEIPAHEVAQEPAVQAEELPIPPIADEAVQTPPIAVDDTSKLTPDKSGVGSGPDLTLTPSKDKLTEENVEHLPDESHPPPTETAFSTVASSRDIGSAVATPLGTSQAPVPRLGIGGFATSALKATSTSGHRSASFQRRLMEQHEAVVMPGNHAVDRAAVQFGSLGLGESSDLDVDEDREEAETREQPPQHSPVAQPRAALPPAPRQAPPAAETQQESVPTPKQAPGLPPVPQQQQPFSQQSPSASLGGQSMQPQGSNQRYDQFGRYGQPGLQSDAAAPPQKAYDPFGQQIPSQSNQYDYPGQQGQQSQAQSQPGAFSSAPDNFGSQYLTSEQRYQNYYGSYGQQGAPSQQEAGSAQQRTGSAFGSGPNDSAFSQSQQQQGQGRYDAQNSGHNTPNPALGGQQPGAPGSQSHNMQQHAGQQGHSGAYPYNHPYYTSPYYANYMNQFGGYNQGAGYGSFGKGMYGQPHHYGMSPQAAYEQHSSSPANAGGFAASALHERSSGLGEYGRSASGTSQNHSATAGAGGFGGFPDSFGRQQGYSGQSSYAQQQGGQPGASEDSLKPFGDPKNGGPSPSALGAQQGRPGSATQNTPGQAGPQQSHQQGFGGYPSHLGGNSQYGGGLGGLGHQGAGSHQQQSQYGNYGGGFGGGYGSGSYSRGGWGGNYGGHN
ncbi:hypothetical protein HBI67_064100 [Parastagonospora nodorum]|nr:hypothetical protein HBI67_064100 [Parastagonospora nodorum]KAH6088087.1 hypothetical protein HBI66_033270 [Parastagonospora nodorum]